MKKLFVLFGILFFAGIAHSSVIDWESIDCQQLLYNGRPLAEARIQLPSGIAQLVNGETVNVFVNFDSGIKRQVSGKAANGVISEISCTSRNDATLQVFAEGTALDQIAESKKPIKEFKKLKAEGKIRFESKSFTTGIKLFLSEIFLFFQ